MSEELREFVSRVERFEIDPGDKSLRFVDRLARENSWKLAFSERVELEYKRFCILAMRAGHPVTPSEQVDQAWHLHLTYTRSYWERFCAETLGKPLHHEPTAGGGEEGEKFRDWYAETLASYERIFGSAPPSDIWPSAEERFKHAGDWKWVNVGRYWMIPRRSTLATVSALLLLMFCVVLPGCQAAMSGMPFGLTLLGELDLFPFNLDGGQFLVFYFVVCFIGIAAALCFRMGENTREATEAGGKAIPELTADELAVLAGGGRRLAQLSIARLFAMKVITAKKSFWSWKFESQDKMPKIGGLDRDMFSAIRAGTAPNRLYSVVKLHYDRIDLRLQSQGLRREGSSVVAPALLIAIAVLALGIVRFGQGIASGNDIGFLAVMIIVAGIGFAFACIKSGRNTQHGVATLTHHEQEAKATQARLSTEPDDIRGLDSVAMCVAVLGTGAFIGMPEFSPLVSAMPQISNTTGAGGGCGAGCSSGGGGCGGGGCGGCGGCGG